MHSTHHNEQGAMWINMNEDTLIAITGIAIVLVFSLPFIVLPAIAYKIFQKRRAAKENARREPEALSPQQEPSGIHEHTSPLKSVVALIVVTLMIVVWALMIGFTVGVVSQLIPVVLLHPLVMAVNSGTRPANSTLGIANQRARYSGSRARL